MAEIVVGIMLGPSLLGLLPGDLTARLFPPAVRSDLSAVAEISILLFMFLIGWEMDLGQAPTPRGAVLGVSLSSTALPLGSGVVRAVLLDRHPDTLPDYHVAAH